MLKVILLSFLIISLNAYAMPILHLFKPHANFTQVVSQDTCAFFTKRKDSVGCNPALFYKNATEGLKFFIGAKSDGDSIDTGQKLIFENIKKEFLEELFEDKNFNSFGGGAFLEFNTPYFYLNYDPLYVTADVFVFNPAYPEISMSLHNSKRLGLTSGTRISFLSNTENSLDIGGSLFYYEDNYYEDSFSLFQLTNQSADELINFKRNNSIASDIGLTYTNTYQFLPNISILIKNLFSHYKLDEDRLTSEKYLQPILTYENYSRFNLGYDFSFDYGSINTEVSLPFSKVFENYYSEYSSLALGYSLGTFSTTASVSKYITNFGFKFESSSSSIGIYYSKIKSLGDFSQKAEDTAGFTFEVYL